MIAVTCLVGGSILISIGMLGEYVGRIFEAIKGRPLYLIASRVTREEKVTTAPVYEKDPVQQQLAVLSGAIEKVIVRDR